jgi:hypothetical protein
MVGATMIDNGYPTIEASPRFVFFLRAGTPANVLDATGVAFRTAIQDRQRRQGPKEHGRDQKSGRRRRLQRCAPFNKEWGEVRIAKIVAKVFDDKTTGQPSTGEWCAITSKAGISRKCLKEHC